MKLFRNLSIFVLTFLSILVVSFYGCQKEVAQVSPKVGGNQDLKVETRGLGDFVNVVNYNLYPDWTLGQYWQKARKGTCDPKYANIKIKDINCFQYGNCFGRNGGQIVREKQIDFTAFIYTLDNKNNYAAWTTFTDGQKYVVYRGGNSIIAAGYKIFENLQKQTMVVGETTLNTKGLKANGPSFNMDPTNKNIVNNGGAFKISSSIPEGLVFTQQGQDIGHFVLVPKNDMLEATYLSKVAQIKTLDASF
jgi:hypothetical protein